MNTTRREFLKYAMAAATGTAVIEATAADSSPRRGLIDVNVNLARWPTRRLRLDATAEFAKKLRSHGVTQAWASSFDALLHKDLAEVNTWLVEQCRRHGRGMLIPFGAINPKAPDWEQELSRCLDDHHMPGLRLHPGYHGYKLDDPSFARLLRLAADRHLIMQLCLVMEDERMMHPLLRVEAVDTTPLLELVKRTPGVRLVLLNALRTLRAKPLLELIAAGDVSVEIAMLEGVGGVANLLSQVPANRVLFGSYAPLFYFESALLKLKESALSERQLQMLRRENAERLLAKATHN